MVAAGEHVHGQQADGEGHGAHDDLPWMRGHQEAVGAEQRAEHGCGGADLLQQEGGGSNLQDRQPNRITSFPSGQKPEPVLLRSKLHQEKPSSELCLLSITSAALKELSRSVH